MSDDDQQLLQQMQRVEALIQEMDHFADPKAREIAREVVQCLLDLHGAGLNTILQLTHEAGEPGRELIEAFASDELVSHLLLLYGLHPLDMETRVVRALERGRPYFRSHQGDVELVGFRDGVVHLRLVGTCQECPSFPRTRTLVLEHMLYEAAPDLVGIEIEGWSQPTAPRLVPLPLLGQQQADPTPGGWERVIGLPELKPGQLFLHAVSGQPLLFCRLEEHLCAYSSRCPGCNGRLEQGTFEAPILSCSGCALRFDLRRAGLALDGNSSQLEPFPLLIEESSVRVALPAMGG